MPFLTLFTFIKIQVGQGPFDIVAALQNLIGTRVLGCTLKCGHRCCNHCLKRWLAVKKMCPICRRAVSDVSSPVPSTIQTLPGSELEHRLDTGYPFLPVEIPPPSLVSHGTSSATAGSVEYLHRVVEERNAELFNRFRHGPDLIRPGQHEEVFIDDHEVESVESVVVSPRTRRRSTRRRWIGR